MSWNVPCTFLELFWSIRLVLLHRISKVHPRFKRDALGVSSKRVDPLTRSDFLLDSRQWSSLIVGKISEVTLIFGSAFARRKSYCYGTARLLVSSLSNPFR